MRPLRADPDLWRMQAYGIREAARLVRDPVIRARMIKIAENYENLARPVERPRKRRNSDKRLADG